ncbi:hypothetical protein OHC33_010007 [Knufia fluminis]|uniref:UDP-glucose 6-dehydrogenase n=1 Tax=Knufia fluminis TaxID=191047 RepID=A0AAN8I413_9EURO|nr:hypothetical protein OHC33_010007 [Knufia fluminis]
MAQSWTANSFVSQQGRNPREGEVKNESQRAIKSICCIGGGYVGGPSGAVIANRAPSTKVTVVDVNSDRIDAWNSTKLPVYEPYLYDLVAIARDGIPGQREPNLFFSTQVDEAIREADLIFVGVNTPTKTSGLGAGKASDLGWLEMATRRIARCADHDTIVIEKSTVPCGTAQDMQEILKANAKPGVQFEVLSNPEFLAEGTAISNLLCPDRVLIGCFETESGRTAANRLADVYANWVPKDRIITMNIWSAELSKLASNALLAQRISSINALSSICEATGANIEEVSYACGLDTRIGPKMLSASVGFGGSCFKKDIMNLTHISESLNLPEVAAYWKSVVEVNEYQKNRFTQQIVDTMHSTLSRKKIAVLGFAYKKNTGDTRESAAISVVRSLLDENAIVAIYDPKVRRNQIFDDLKLSTDDQRIQVCSDPYDACEDAHAVVILTEWDMFSNQEKRTTPARLGKKPDFEAALRASLSDTMRGKDPISDGLDSGYDSGHSYSPGASSPDLESAHVRPSTPDFVVQQIAKPRKQTSELSEPQQLAQKKLDWSRVSSLMQRPMYVFDGRNTVDAQKLRSLGFHVVSIGSSASNSK